MNKTLRRLSTPMRSGFIALGLGLYLAPKSQAAQLIPVTIKTSNETTAGWQSTLAYSGGGKDTSGTYQVDPSSKNSVVQMLPWDPNFGVNVNISMCQAPNCQRKVGAFAIYTKQVPPTEIDVHVFLQGGKVLLCRASIK